MELYNLFFPKKGRLLSTSSLPRLSSMRDSIHLKVSPLCDQTLLWISIYIYFVSNINQSKVWILVDGVFFYRTASNTIL